MRANSCEQSSCNAPMQSLLPAILFRRTCCILGLWLSAASSAERRWWLLWKHNQNKEQCNQRITNCTRIIILLKVRRCAKRAAILCRFIDESPPNIQHTIRADHRTVNVVWPLYAIRCPNSLLICCWRSVVRRFVSSKDADLRLIVLSSRVSDLIG